MKFGIAFANSGAFSNPALMGHLATTAERCGIESLWTVEHVAIPVKHRRIRAARTVKCRGATTSRFPIR